MRLAVLLLLIATSVNAQTIKDSQWAAYLQKYENMGQTVMLFLKPIDDPPPCIPVAGGALYADKTLRELCVCNGTVWCRVGSDCSTGTKEKCG